MATVAAAEVAVEAAPEVIPAAEEGAVLARAESSKVASAVEKEASSHHIEDFVEGAMFQHEMAATPAAESTDAAAGEGSAAADDGGGVADDGSGVADDGSGATGGKERPRTFSRNVLIAFLVLVAVAFIYLAYVAFEDGKFLPSNMPNPLRWMAIGAGGAAVFTALLCCLRHGPAA